ncbi:OsmC family protein [Halosolutus amylolyticus]|uniref:OsmC family protein n=1 Tax=Halosolutus amylolyticus TaxID=2932267 RepID=A0ABD5PP62_9EURY|nr:OsmC family protein [Halosolutus amylolyticus]
MTDIDLTTTNEDGFDTRSAIGDFTVAVDPMNETGPNPNELLVADYASCFLPAVRLGARKNGIDDLGKMEIAAEADLDDHDNLEAIRFTLYVEAALDDPDELATIGEQHCHIHTTLRDGLHADVTVVDDAY